MLTFLRVADSNAAIQRFHSLAAVDEIGSHFDTGTDGIGFAGNEQGRSGIQEDGVSFRPLNRSLQDASRDVGIFFRRAADEVFLRSRHHAEVFRPQNRRPIISVAEFTNRRRPVRRNFIEFFLAVGDDTSFDAKGRQYFRQGFDQVFIVNAEEDHRRFSRAGQGPEDVEYGPESQFLADGSDILHSGMIFLSKEEAEVRFFQHLKCQFRILFDIETQCFQAVCRTAQRRGSSIAVFGYLNTGRGNNHGRRRRNIERMGTVAAGTDDFQDIHARMRNGRCHRAHGFGTA